MGHGSDENICECGRNCEPYRFCKICGVIDNMSDEKPKRKPMSENQKKARLNRMKKAMKTPQSYLSKNIIKDNEEWKRTKNDNLPRY